ncbi:MAG: CoA-binding protein [Deltaproteobacteria bacterium]|nr:CoA-binding protein [Deltaproteobacteria bacterium]
MLNSAIEQILKQAKTVAVVGLSDKEGRPSLKVASYLKNQGYHIIPVNPKIDKVLGVKSYPDLASIPHKIDIVDIFRKSEDVLPIVEEAVKIGARLIWMQEGVINKEAAGKGIEAGLEVVMDKCMLKEHAKLSQDMKDKDL